jgi:hypothetical protein
MANLATRDWVCFSGTKNVSISVTIAKGSNQVTSICSPAWVESMVSPYLSMFSGFQTRPAPMPLASPVLIIPRPDPFLELTDPIITTFALCGSSSSKSTELCDIGSGSLGSPGAR